MVRIEEKRIPRPRYWRLFCKLGLHETRWWLAPFVDAPYTEIPTVPQCRYCERWLLKD